MRKPPFWLSLSLVGSLVPEISLSLDPRPVDLPFALHGHLIVVKGSIGPLEDLNLVLDTGASLTVVSREVARELDLGGPRSTVNAYGRKQRVERVTLSRLALGPLEFEEVPAQIAALSFSGMDRFLRIDGLIGLELLRRSGVSIDYEAKRVVFGPVRHSGPTIAFYNRLPIIAIPLTIGGARVSLLLDTGAEHLVLFQRRMAGRVPVRPTGERETIVCLGRRVSLAKARIRDAALGESRWDELSAHLLDVPVGDSDPDGILGVAALGLKRLNLDFPNQRLSWER